MCYSAQTWADYRRYIRHFGAIVDIREYVRIFERRAQGARVLIPKGMEAPFLDPQTDDEREARKLVDAYTDSEMARQEEQVFSQRRRYVAAEQKLAVKVTKAASEDVRIGKKKVQDALERIEELKRKEPARRDSRIYPGMYAPVMVLEEGQLVVKPMRYQCRPANTPAFFDKKFPGLYNARRGSLGNFWKKQFGYTHGVMMVNVFYENVERHRMEGRELAEGEVPEKVVLEFRPQPEQNMLIACLWSKWVGKDEELLSFAAITDEPPPEVAAAGHDRCIIQIREENLMTWLAPDPKHLEVQRHVFDDKPRPFYEHRLAA